MQVPAEFQQYQNLVDKIEILIADQCNKKLEVMKEMDLHF